MAVLTSYALPKDCQEPSLSCVLAPVSVGNASTVWPSQPKLGTIMSLGRISVKEMPKRPLNQRRDMSHGKLSLPN
jgi:hypothetical protein